MSWPGWTRRRSCRWSSCWRGMATTTWRRMAGATEAAAGTRKCVVSEGREGVRLGGWGMLG